MPDLRIALLTGSTRPRGSVVHTLALAEALARTGHRVSVWALAEEVDPGFFRPVDPAVQVHLVPVPEIADEAPGARVQRSTALLSAAFAEATAGSAEYDVIHAQDAVTAVAVPGRIRTVHHLEQFTTPELVAGHERGLLEPVATVCLSAATAADLAGNWGRTATVIPGGVEAARFAAAAGPDPEAVRQRRYWTDRLGDYVLTVGGIEPRKGTLDLVRAMARVRRRRPGTRLVIAGGDTHPDYWEYRRDVDVLAQRLRIDPEVLGAVEHARLPGLVAAAGVFVFPSVQDGFGSGALEALAAGVPVVTRDRPVFREAFGTAVRAADIGDGSSGDVSAGLATQVVAALEAPAGSGGDAVVDREAGQKLAAGYDWADTAAAHLELYGRLIDTGLSVGTSA